MFNYMILRDALSLDRDSRWARWGLPVVLILEVVGILSTAMQVVQLHEDPFFYPFHEDLWQWRWVDELLAHSSIFHYQGREATVAFTFYVLQHSQSVPSTLLFLCVSACMSDRATALYLLGADSVLLAAVFYALGALFKASTPMNVWWGSLHRGRVRYVTRRLLSAWVLPQSPLSCCILGFVAPLCDTPLADVVWQAFFHTVFFCSLVVVVLRVEDFFGQSWYPDRDRGELVVHCLPFFGYLLLRCATYVWKRRFAKQPQQQGVDYFAPLRKIELLRNGAVDVDGVIKARNGYFESMRYDVITRHLSALLAAPRRAAVPPTQPGGRSVSWKTPLPCDPPVSTVR